MLMYLRASNITWNYPARSLSPSASISLPLSLSLSLRLSLSLPLFVSISLSPSLPLGTLSMKLAVRVRPTHICINQRASDTRRSTCRASRPLCAHALTEYKLPRPPEPPPVLPWCRCMRLIASEGKVYTEDWPAARWLPDPSTPSTLQRRRSDCDPPTCYPVVSG